MSPTHQRSREKGKPFQGIPGFSIFSRLQDIETSSISAQQTLISTAPPPPIPPPSIIPSYPPVSSLPRTCPTRLSLPDVCPTPFPTEPTPSDSSTPPSPQAQSILYLAYGSNLSAETFLGVRGIRPLSAVNVSAPSLSLVFDLPGIPYREPCFANTAPRKIPGVPDRPPKLPPDLPHPPTSNRDDGQEDPDEKTSSPTWTRGLIGVVYEVTPSDYAKILATEGGGSSYRDILVPCVPLPARIGVPERPPVPEFPKPFLAHTLCAPRLPDLPDERGDTELPTWLKRLLLPVRRPNPGYSEPSARYLKLIRDGAREHELPDEYQAYLAGLRPYTITTTRQKVGMVLLLAAWAPAAIILFAGQRLLAGRSENGQVPRWYVRVTMVFFNLFWGSYDLVFKPVFGDGERTMDGEDKRRKESSWWWSRRRESGGSDEEKICLLR